MLKLNKTMPSNTQNPRSPGSIAEVVRSGLCIGCGLCEALAPAVYKMVLTQQGTLRPMPLASAEHSRDSELLSCCPGAVVKANQLDTRCHQDDLWGQYTSMARMWAADDEVRFKAATGGVLTALAQWLLVTGHAEFILHCGANPAKPMQTHWVLSETPAQILANTASRYGPSDTLAGLEQALARGQRFAVIAKPCDANAIKALAEQDERVSKNVIMVLVMVCGGASDLGKSEALLEEYQIEERDLALFRYRGYGNPGPTRLETKDGQVFEKSYQQMWADEAGWRIQSRCKICPDPNGEAADVAAADIWPEANPSGEDAGFNGVIARTPRGQSMLDSALSDGALETDLVFTPRDFDHFQPHQVSKKRAIAARLRGLAAAGHAVYKHQHLRIDELDSGNKEEQRGAEKRAQRDRFSEPWPPIPRV